MPQKRSIQFLIPVTVLLTVLIYAYGFNGTFVYDDYGQIVYNPEIQNAFHIKEVIFNGLRQIRIWQNFIFSIAWTVSGGETWSFKLISLGFHLINSMLFFKLIQRVFPERPMLPRLATAFFLIHPLQTQTVTYVMGLVTLLQSFFYLFLLDWIAKYRLNRMLPLCGVLALSIFAKETAMLIPLVLFVFDFLILRKDHEPIAWKKWAIIFLVPLIYFPFKVILEDPTSMYQGVTGFGLFGFFPYIAAQFYYQIFYLALLFKPSWQSMLHDHPVLSPISIAAAVSGGLLWMISAWFMAFRWRRYPGVAFLILFYFILYFPTNSFFQMINPFAEYRLYLTTGILMVGLSSILIGFSQWLDAKKIFRQALLSVSFLFVIGFSFYTFMTVMLWKQEVSILLQAEELYPKSAFIQEGVAVAYFHQGDFKSSLRYLIQTRKLKAYPDSQVITVCLLIAESLMREGRTDEAWTVIEMMESDRSVERYDPKFYHLKELIVKNAIESGKIPLNLPPKTLKIYDTLIPY